jgi:hypothetical protein
MKDYQRKRVYAWENAVVGPRCSTIVPYCNGQTYIDGVWLSQGWIRPPQVVPLSTRAIATMAKANHGQVYLPRHRPLPAWVLLHELSHSLTDDAHGPNFVGMYIDLLERVEKLPKLMTMFSLQQAKVDFNLAAQPLSWVTRR